MKPYHYYVSKYFTGGGHVRWDPKYKLAVRVYDDGREVPMPDVSARNVRDWNSAGDWRRVSYEEAVRCWV